MARTKRSGARKPQNISTFSRRVNHVASKTSTAKRRYGQKKRWMQMGNNIDTMLSMIKAQCPAGLVSNEFMEAHKSVERALLLCKFLQKKRLRIVDTQVAVRGKNLCGRIDAIVADAIKKNAAPCIVEVKTVCCDSRTYISDQRGDTLRRRLHQAALLQARTYSQLFPGTRLKSYVWVVACDKILVFKA